MKKLCFGKVFLLFISTLVVIPFAMADQIRLYQQTGYSYGSGGEFTLSIVDSTTGPDLNVYWSYYSPLTRVTRDIGNYDPSFQTFCLEMTEYFTPGWTYYVTISDRAILGGVGTDGDPISIGTAWLYYMFATGQLSVYDYTAGPGRSADAGALQATIWWLEGERNDPGTGNEFRNLVLSNFSNPMADNNWTYPVAVLNLTNAGSYVQDQLILVGVPEPSTLLLMGAGLIGIGVFGRKRFRRKERV